MDSIKGNCRLCLLGKEVEGSLFLSSFVATVLAFREIFAHLCYLLNAHLCSIFGENSTSCSWHRGHLSGILRTLFSLHFGMIVFTHCRSLDIVSLAISTILLASRAFII